MDRDSSAYSTAGDSPEHAHKYLLWRLCRAHGPQCLETLRVVSGAENGGDSLGHAHSRCVWRLSRALCRQWLETVRPASAAKSQVIHLDMSDLFCLASVSCTFSALELA